MVKMAKEVFTKVIHHNDGEIAAGITVKSTEEFIAAEDMYMVGCAFGKTQSTSGGQCILTLCRSGTQVFVGSYDIETEMESDDFILFVWREMGQEVTSMPPNASQLQILPFGTYFFVEKGERIYLHASVKNNGAAPLNFAHDAILYYTKSKP